MIHLDSREAFRRACDLMHSGALYAAFRRLTSIVDDAAEDRSLKKSGLWARAKCRQRMALSAKTLEETISLGRAALADRADAVQADPEWFAHEMLGNRWYPQHPAYLPAYLKLLESNSISVKWAVPEFVEAIGQMGTEAADAVPALRIAREKWPEAFQIDAAMEQITKPPSNPGDSTITPAPPPLAELVAEAIATYPGRDGSNEDPPIPTDEIVGWPEGKLSRLLEDPHEKTRELASCALRFASENPERATLFKLFDHAGPDEERARVRGQCLLALTDYASTQVLCGHELEKLLALLQDRLASDGAVSVQSIAAESLAKIGGNRVDVVSSLVSALKAATNPNLTWTLIRAVAECGHAAREALPQVLSVSPRLGNALDDLIQATAILYMAPEDSREHESALTTILSAVRWQPTNKPTSLSRERRSVALNAICDAPISETLRYRFLLERFFLDESAALRRIAGRKLVSLDDDLAKSAGADRLADAPFTNVCQGKLLTSS